MLTALVARNFDVPAVVVSGVLFERVEEKVSIMFAVR